MFSRISLRLLIILTLVATLWIASPARPTQAATFTIPCGDTAALITAVNTANGTPEADTINLTAGCTYNFAAVNLPLTITTPITINGNGSTLQLDPSNPVAFTAMFRVYNSGSLTINDSTLHSRIDDRRLVPTLIENHSVVVLNNSTLSNNSGYEVILNLGNITINSCMFVNNSTTPLVSGGGTVFINSSTFSGNTLSAINSIMGAVITITNSTFSGNNCLWDGGAIHAIDSTLTISGSTFSGNQAAGSSGGGAIFIENNVLLTVTNSVFSGNSAPHGAAYMGAAAPGSSITGSCFLNNTNTAAGGFDLSNSNSNSFNATNNWWGSASGPGVNAVSTYIVTTPFLTALAPACGGVIPAAASTGPSAADHARAQASLCADVNGNTDSVVQADIPGGTVPNGSVYCRVITANGTYRPGSSAAQIGNADVIGRGVIQAVDVFGTAGASAVTTFIYPVKVCLQGSGAFLFLDALTSPRALSQLPTTSEGGYTCATLPNAGTAVLVNP